MEPGKDRISDLSDKMIAAAKKNVPKARFYTDWDSIYVDFEHSLLNISSVIHEVYSYCTHEDIELKSPTHIKLVLEKA